MLDFSFPVICGLWNSRFLSPKQRFCSLGKVAEPGSNGSLQPAPTWPQPEAEETSLAKAKGLTATLIQPHSTRVIVLSSS